MPHLLRLMASMAILALCTGCASIVSGTNQSLSITSAGPSGTDVAGAKCMLANDKGSWYATTPGSVTVHRSYGDLTVNCTLDGVDPGATTIKSSTKGMAAGNILFGGLIGVGVDVASGAAYDYPNLIRVTMGQPVGAMPGPPAALGAAPASTTIALVTSKNTVVPITPVAIGTRISFLDTDPVSGGSLGESTHVVSGIEPGGAMSFNDGTIVASADGSPMKGALHGAMIYGVGADQLGRGGTWSGRFRAPLVSVDVPVEISVIGLQAKVISGRSFQAVRLRVEGFSSRENVIPSSSVGGSPFTGEMLVDKVTGLVLEIKVRSRHPSYNVQRELVRVAGA
jgi:hypothetical protein